MAHQAGHQVLAVDAFADADTQDYACQTAHWAGFHAEVPRLHLPALAHTLSDFAPEAVLIGSGFEADIEGYDWLYQRFPVFANRPEVVQHVKDPLALKASCDRAGVDSPAITTTPPTQGQWLRKQQGQCGGWHVSAWPISALPTDTPFADADEGRSPFYWQQYCDGMPVGLLFLARPDGVSFIGVHRLLHGADNFVYAGALRGETPALWQAAEALLQRLVPHLALQGLNSLDAIWQAPTLQVIEVNPRLSASMRLYTHLPLIAAHLACYGAEARSAGQMLAEAAVQAAQARWAAHSIVYVRDAVSLPAVALPDWVEDRPNQLQHAAGQPLCSLYAEGPSESAVTAALQQQQQQLEQLWGTYVCEQLEFNRFERSARQCTAGRTSD